MRTLAGGRQEGVEVIEVDNGVLKFTVVPTRGFNVWTASVGELRLGWDSPVKEIVHPQFVNLTERGGLGWLNGFGEWISRCGLESMGAPCKDGNLILTLHGRINYIPASYVEVCFEPKPVPRIVLRGTIDESLMFGPQLRLMTEISTEIGKPTLTLDDSVINLSDAPQEMESLYHINFGPPLLGAGAQFVAPVKKVAPRDPRAAEGMAGWNGYTGPHQAGYTEEVYLMELYADEKGLTEALLKSADATKGALLSFSVHELPFMTLWKNEAPSRADAARWRSASEAREIGLVDRHAVDRDGANSNRRSAAAARRSWSCLRRTVPRSPPARLASQKRTPFSALTSGRSG